MDDQIERVLDYHKDHLKTAYHWEEYLKDNTSLPPVEEVLSKYTKWKNLRKSLNISVRVPSFREDELLEIAKHYQEKFTTVRGWDSFADIYGLPKSVTYIKQLGNWNEIKEKLNFVPTSRDDYNYSNSKESIISVLKEHGSEYTNRTDWDVYAKENSLPTYKTIRKYISYDELKTIVKSNRYTNEELIKIARDHRENFTSINKWNEHARENKLPNATTYIRRFETWKNARIKVHS